MPQITDYQVAAYARRAGFFGDAWVRAVAVALAESGGRTDAVNTRGNEPPSRDRGLWQINDYWHHEVSDAQAFDPDGCAMAAYRISDGGRDWQQWATYESGRYRQFVPRAIHAAAAISHPGVIRRYLAERHPYLTGADVRAVQMLVGATPDAVYGPLTAADVAAWQNARGLNPDGVWGPASTRAAGWIWAPPAAPVA